VLAEALVRLNRPLKLITWVALLLYAGWATADPVLMFMDAWEAMER